MTEKVGVPSNLLDGLLGSQTQRTRTLNKAEWKLHLQERVPELFPFQRFSLQRNYSLVSGTQRTKYEP